MCYLVTADPTDIVRFEATNAKEPKEYQTLPEARKYAEHLALNNVKNVRVWLLTHSVEIQPQAVWTNHAKALSGQE